MRTSDAIDQIATALSKAQGAIKPAVKDATNPHFRSKYADLSSFIEAIRKPMADNGLSYLQEATTDESGAAITTRILHTSGQWIEVGPLTIPVGKSDAHGVGSAVTYGKRYALSAALGIAADEDDDGNAAVQVNGHAKRQTAPQAPEGFDAWLLDLEATAIDGTAALEGAWKKSQPYLRKHLIDTDNAKWERLKAKAAAVKQPEPAHA